LGSGGSVDKSVGNDGNKGDNDDEGNDNSIVRTVDILERNRIEVEAVEVVVELLDSYVISFH
jgi:hypothetical protein